MRVLLLLCIALIYSLQSMGQYGFRRSTQDIEKGKYYLVYQKRSIRDCDDNSYYKLHSVKAEITDVETIGKYVTSFHLYQVNHFSSNLQWTWDHETDPVAFQREMGSVFLYPYNGTIYLLSDPFYEDVEKFGERLINGENHDVCITGWLQKKKPKAVDVGKNKASVDCPVSIDELREDAMKTMQKRIDEDSIKFPANVSVEGKTVANYELKTEWTHFEDYSLLKVGVIAELADGTTYLTNNFKEGFGLYSDYKVEVYGGCLEHTKYIEDPGGFYEGFRLKKISWADTPLNDEDFVQITVIQKFTGEQVINDKIALIYPTEMQLDYSNPNGGYCSDGWDGGEVVIDIKEVVHSVTNEPLLYYTIKVNNYYQTDGFNYLKMPVGAELTIFNDGGRGGDCTSDEHKKGGKAGVFVVNNETNYELDHLDLYARDGYDGSFGYAPATYNSGSSSSNSSSTSDEITITNNTGSSVCIAHSGGSTSISNGSSESFSCRDLYYGVMDGAHCTSQFGSKIADEDSDCGRTITLE